MVKLPKKPRVPALKRDAAEAVLLRGETRNRRHADQPALPFDVMPARVEPCLALLVTHPPEGADWAYEIKWDGYRLGIHVEADSVRLLTRGGHDWTHRFPTIATAAAELGPTSMILDGEAVVLDQNGQPSFSALQEDLGGRGGKKTARKAIFYAFDLLYIDGHDISSMALAERRMMLEDILPSTSGAIRLSEEIEADGKTLLLSVCEQGLEGIIAKNRSAPYRSGRTGDWLKIKCVQSESFAIIGYQLSTKMPGAIASLLLAARKKGQWVHVGNVGTGFSNAMARGLKTTLDALKLDRSVAALKGPRLVHVEPRLVAEIEFRAWTGDGKLRHASFKGLRDETDAASVMEMP